MTKHSSHVLQDHDFRASPISGLQHASHAEPLPSTSTGTPPCMPMEPLCPVLCATAFATSLLATPCSALDGALLHFLKRTRSIQAMLNDAMTCPSSPSAIRRRGGFGMPSVLPVGCALILALGKMPSVDGPEQPQEGILKPLRRPCLLVRSEVKACCHLVILLLWRNRHQVLCIHVRYIYI